MASPTDLKFDSALLNRARFLGGLGLQVQDYALKAMVGIARKAAQRAAELTPRSDGGGPHVADGWTTEEKVEAARVNVRVYNKEPRATDLLKLADGSTAPYSLLEILEYGSDEHEIRPVNGEYLVFFWGKVGKVVAAKVVHHPGTRPYSMMALAKKDANVDIKLTIDAIRKVMRDALSGKAASPKAA